MLYVLLIIATLYDILVQIIWKARLPQLHQLQSTEAWLQKFRINLSLLVVPIPHLGVSYLLAERNYTITRCILPKPLAIFHKMISFVEILEAEMYFFYFWVLPFIISLKVWRNLQLLLFYAFVKGVRYKGSCAIFFIFSYFRNNVGTTK